MSMIGVFILLAGRLAAAGFACGLNIYATVALVGSAARLDWIQLPPGLLGLEQGILIAAALTLFAADMIAATVPVVDAVWEAVHTIIRPAASGALAVLALEPAPWTLRLLGGFVTAGAALASHTASLGLRLVMTRRGPVRMALGAGAAVLAAALAAATVLSPWTALAGTATLTAILAAAGQRLWRAAAFAARAVRAALRGFFGERRWHHARDLPASLRLHLPPTEVGLPEPRAARAALDSRESGPWRNGWLVIDGHSAIFLYRSAFRTRSVRLPRPDEPTIQTRALADTVTWRHDRKTFTLRLLKDGPPAEIAAGSLQLLLS